MNVVKQAEGIIVSVSIGMLVMITTYSLKTMEERNLAGHHIPNLEWLSAQELAKIPIKELINKLYDKTSAIHAAVNKSLVKRLLSDQLLNEFRAHGTIDGEPITTLLPDEWAIQVFKPALDFLTYPFVMETQLHHAAIVHALAFSPDDRHLATGPSGQSVLVWTKQEDGSWQSQQLEEVASRNHKLIFSPDSRQLASGSADGTVRVWTQDEHTVWQAQELRGHTQRIRSLVFSPDGTRLVSGSLDRSIRVWTQNEPALWQAQELRGHTDTITSVVFSPDGTQLVSGSLDHTIRIWTQQKDATWQSHVLRDNDKVISVAFSPDANQLAAGLDNGTVHIWIKKEDDSWQSQELQGHVDKKVETIMFSPDGRKLFSASEGEVYVWVKNEHGTWLPHMPVHFVYSVAFNQDGSQFCSSRENTALIWTHQEDNSWQSEALKGHANVVNLLAFSHDGRRLASAAWDETVRIWQKKDIVGRTNVAAKIMLLQLLHRESKDIFARENSDTIMYQNLLKIFYSFDHEVQKYLKQHYDIDIPIQREVPVSSVFKRAVNWAQSFF